MDVKQHESKPPRPLSPSVPAVAGRELVIVRAAAYASDSGESLHCFLVGANKNYVIATSDLWLYIHVSNMLPSTPQPAPLDIYQSFIIVCLLLEQRDVYIIIIVCLSIAWKKDVYISISFISHISFIIVCLPIAWKCLNKSISFIYHNYIIKHCLFVYCLKKGCIHEYMLYISYIIYHRFSVAIKNVYLSISFTYHIFIIVCLLLGGGGDLPWQFAHNYFCVILLRRRASF